VRPRARRGGRHVPEQCGGEGASQSVVQKGGGGVISQKKGNGEARDYLECFVATVRAWELPQKCHVHLLVILPRLSFLTRFSHSSPPHQQRLIIFPLLPHDRSPFLIGAQGPLLLTNMSTGSPLFSNLRAWHPCHPVCLFFFFFFPTDRSFSLTGALGPPRSQTLGGLTVS
jgi:hypothetical protein